MRLSGAFQEKMKVVNCLLIFGILCCCGYAQAQLSGAYTINPKENTSRNYKSLQAAAADLYSKGVSGAVTFSISPGTYQERVLMMPITGVSATNTIVFDGKHRDSVKITFASNSGNERATWHFDGSDYVIVKNLTLEGTGTYRTAIHFANEANHNAVENCALLAEGSSTNYRNIVFASNTWKAGNHGNYNSVKNCSVIGGYYGIYIMGQGFFADQHNQGNYFENLKLTEVYSYGVYNAYSDSTVFFHCDLSPDYAFGYGIYNYYGTYNTYNSCTVTGSGYGLYDQYAEFNTVESCKFSAQRNHNIYNYKSDHQRYLDNQLWSPDYYNYYAFGASHTKFVGNDLLGSTKYTHSNLYVSNGFSDTLMGNTLRLASRHNMYLYQCQESLLANNMVYGDLPGTTNNESNCYLLSCRNLRIYHNTFYNAGGGGINYGSVAYYLPTNLMNYYSSAIDVQNNIFEYAGNFKGAVNIASYLGSFSMLDYNNYQTTEETAIDNFDHFESLAIWKRGNNAFNSNSSNEKIYFLDLTRGDLHLSTQYAALTGAELGLYTDVDQDMRCLYAQTLGADESEFPVTPPQVGFSVDDTVFLRSPFMALNRNVNSVGMRHYWSVDGWLIDSTKHLEHVLTSKGRVLIKLQTVNCGGADDTSMWVQVDSSTIAPIADFALSDYEIDLLEDVSTYDLSRFGPTDWKWRITPDSIYDPLIFDHVPTYELSAGTEDDSNHLQLRFFYPGYYSVGLRAGNASGKDSVLQQDVLLVKASNALCVSPNTIQTPSGTLFDDGGRYNSYGNNLNCRFLIDPCASEVRLVLKSIDLESGYDFLKIFDGRDSTGIPLWNVNAYGTMGITGNTLGSGFDSVLVARTGQMFVQFTSNKTNSGEGFVAEWTSKAASFKAPKARFSAPDSVCVGHPIAFENTSKGDVTSYLWNFAVNNFSISQKESPSYVFDKEGTYRVRLQANGCAGVDVLSKTVTAYYGTQQPKGDFIADITRPALGDVVTLTPETQYCVDSFEWSIDPPTGFDFVGFSDKRSENPQIQFNRLGTYSISLRIVNRKDEKTLIKKRYIEVQDYCTPAEVSTSADVGIYKVVLNGVPTLENESSAGSNYSNFSAMGTTLERNGVYELAISRATQYNKVLRAAWIDWNQDGTFDGNERVLSELGNGNYAKFFSDTFRVPLSAELGGTRMRVLSALSATSLSPCDAQTGEYEDYRIFVSKDKTAPVITLKGDTQVYIEQCQTYVDSGAVVCDRIDGCGLNYQVQGSVNTLVADTYNLVYQALDKAGNRAFEVHRRVIVGPDRTPPSIELIGPDTLRLAVFTAYKELNAIVSDACGKVTLTVLPKVDTAVLGTYTVLYEANDGTNGRLRFRTVVVEDQEAPTLLLNGRSTIYHDVHQPFVDPGYVIDDNYYQQIDGGLWATTSNENLDVHCVGRYVLSYQAFDASGNQSSMKLRIVIVQDTVAPVVTLNGRDTMYVEVLQSFKDPGATATDNYDGAMDIPLRKGDFYELFPLGVANSLGEFKVAYHFTDRQGNENWVERVIVVQDTEAPQLELLGTKTVTLCRWASFMEPGTNISDNYDKTVVVTVDASQLNTQTAGFYYVLYTATDASGNTTVKERYVQVIDCNTSVYDLDDLQVSVYPNPTTGLVHVVFDQLPLSPLRLSIWSADGRRVKDIEWSEPAAAYMLPLHDQVDGVYIVRLEWNGGHLVKKITVSR